MKRAAQKISRIRPIPGFRPGKAPYDRVERAVGKDLLRDEAIDDLAQSLYKQVLKDEKIDPYDAGKLDIAQKEPLILKFTVPTRPVVTLGDYRSIHLQPQAGRSNGRRSEQGDRTTPQWTGDDDAGHARGAIERPRDDGHPRRHRRSDADGSPGFATARRSERKRIPLDRATRRRERERTAHDHLHLSRREQLNAGKTATYTVTITDIKEPQLPNLDDEFAKSVSSFETLEQLKGRIRTNLKDQKQVEEDNRFEDEVIDAVIAQAQIEFPASMIEDETDLEINRLKATAQRLGLTWEKYLQLGGKDEKAARAGVRPDAERRVKRLLTLMELAEAEKIEVTGKEVDVEIDRNAMIAESRGGRAAQTRRELSTPETRRNIEFSIKIAKTVARMVAIAKGEPTTRQDSHTGNGSARRTTRPRASHRRRSRGASGGCLTFRLDHRSKQDAARKIGRAVWTSR